MRKIIQDAKSAFSETYSEQLRENGFVLRDESLAVATELAQIVELSRKRGESNIQEGGKRGVIIEAESGWGKDFTAVKTLEALGFQRGNVTDGTVNPVPVSGAKRYYVINAELDFTTLQRTIQRAAREGAVLIIREANALDAGVLEAQVNDILTPEEAAKFSWLLGCDRTDSRSYSNNIVNSPTCRSSSSTSVHQGSNKIDSGSATFRKMDFTHLLRFCDRGSVRANHLLLST